MPKRLFNRDAARGSPTSRTMPTVGAWLQARVEGRVSLRASTLVSYRGHIDRHLIPHLGHLELNDLRPAHIQTMNRDLLMPHGRPGLSASTVQRSTPPCMRH